MVKHINSADYIYYQKVPDNNQLLADYAGKTDFVIDTFGAATYAQNPIHALIYSVLLLKPGAKYTAISSLVPGGENYSAFGDKETQAALVGFFRKHLELEIFIRPTYLKSKVKGKEGTIVQDLLISCERPINCKQEYSLNRFKKLSEQVNKLIGLPEVISVWSDADFGKYQIRRLSYNTRPLELKPLVTPIIVDKNGEVNKLARTEVSNDASTSNAKKVKTFGLFSQKKSGESETKTGKVEFTL